MTSVRGDSRERLLKKPVTVYLDPAQDAALKRLCAKTRVAQTIYLREGVDLVLKRYGRKR